MAVHIALHEAGAAFEARPLSFHRRENRTPAYLALNPEGKLEFGAFGWATEIRSPA